VTGYSYHTISIPLFTNSFPFGKKEKTGLPGLSSLFRPATAAALTSTGAALPHSGLLLIFPGAFFVTAAPAAGALLVALASAAIVLLLISASLVTARLFGLTLAALTLTLRLTLLVISSTGT
jgi:hypothetical protein